MEATKQNNEENKINNSLMRKTKVQLVDIILRKDAVEREVRHELKCGKMKYNSLQSDYEDICDRFATEKQVNKDIIKDKNKYITILYILFAISVIVNVALVIY